MVILYFFRIIQLINKRYGIFRSHFLGITHTQKNKQTNKQKKTKKTWKNQYIKESVFTNETLSNNIRSSDDGFILVIFI